LRLELVGAGVAELEHAATKAAVASNAKAVRSFPLMWFSLSSLSEVIA
jgi:hypothetical protein